MEKRGTRALMFNKIKQISTSKHSAIELSIGTIVIIVLAMTMLILGMVFVRSIMCSGIVLTDQISKNVENEIINLFQSRDYGIKCMGEGGQMVKLGDGGRRQVFCVANLDEAGEYSLKVKNVESLKGVPTRTVQGWVLDQDWKGQISPGVVTNVVLVLDVPKKVSDTSLKIVIEEENTGTGTKQTHISYVDVVHVGAITTAIC